MDNNAQSRTGAPRQVEVAEQDLIGALHQIVLDLIDQHSLPGQHRVMLGVCGAPGVGKSTVAAAVRGGAEHG